MLTDSYMANEETFPTCGFNYKETGFRETNYERHKREEKEHGR